MHRARRHFGFTLIELILVMAVIAITLAIAAPSLSNWNRGSQKRDATDQILSLTRYARAQAVNDARTYRLNIDRGHARYWLSMQDGQDFVPLGNSFGQIFDAPDGDKLDCVQETNQPLDFVEFYPSGRCQIARIRLTDRTGDVAMIECATPAEGFQIVQAATP